MRERATVASPLRLLPQSSRGSQATPSVDSYRDSQTWGQPSQAMGLLGTPTGSSRVTRRGGTGRGAARKSVHWSLRMGIWRQRGIPKPRPLYNLPALLQHVLTRRS